MKKDSNIRIKYSTDNRITIPREICRTMKLQPGTEFYVECANNKIILTKVDKNCALCGHPAEVTYSDGKGFSVNLCKNCASRLHLDNLSCSADRHAAVGDKIYIPWVENGQKKLLVSEVKDVFMYDDKEAISIIAYEDNETIMSVIFSGVLFESQYESVWFTDEDAAMKALEEL